jgi:hypothetical protein
MRRFMMITSTFIFACATKHEVRTESSAGHSAGSLREGESPVTSSSALKEAGGPPVEPLRGLPQMGVHVGMHDGKPVFTTDFNCGESLQAEVDDILVTDPGDTGWNPRIYCHLRSKRGGNNVVMPSGWEYGAELPGYEISGACAPLEKGRKYEVGVTAGGVGFSIFSIESDGNIRVHEESCQKRPAPKNANP